MYDLALPTRSEGGKGGRYKWKTVIYLNKINAPHLAYNYTYVHTYGMYAFIRIHATYYMNILHTFKCIPGQGVIDGPQLDKHTQLVGTQDGPVSYQIVEIVNDNGHKKIEKLQ